MSTEHDPLDLRGQEKRKSELDLDIKLTRESEESDLKYMMGNRRGRRILWRLLEQSGVFRISFNTNAMQMAFNEGTRNYGNRMLAMINTLCPDLYPVMINENTNDYRKSDSGRDKSN